MGEGQNDRNVVANIEKDHVGKSRDHGPANCVEERGTALHSEQPMLGKLRGVLLDAIEDMVYGSSKPSRCAWGTHVLEHAPPLFAYLGVQP